MVTLAVVVLMEEQKAPGVIAYKGYQLKPQYILSSLFFYNRLLSKPSVMWQGRTNKYLKKRNVHEVHEHFEDIFRARLTVTEGLERSLITADKPRYVDILDSLRQ